MLAILSIGFLLSVSLDFPLRFDILLYQITVFDNPGHDEEVAS
jgi:hypothetical protein